MTDGWRQHYKALVYYARYLRGILRHLLKEHKFVIPDWDFYIGEGNDIVNALQKNMDSQIAEEFIDKTKTAIRTVVEILQKNKLI